MLFIVFLVFVFSEGLLFLSFFWVFFHSSCSPSYNSTFILLGIYVPDPCELTYTNTLILSNAALSLGCAFICRESNQNLSIISFILAWTFILLQLKEFRNMAFYINDSIFGSIFFFLTGLHFFHYVMPRRIPDFPDYFNSWNYLSSIGSGITLICWLYLQLARLDHERVNQQMDPIDD